MTNGIANRTSALVKQDIFNPVVRFGADKREGKLLLRNLRRNLDNPEAAMTIQGLRDQIFFAPTKGGKAVGFAGPRGREGATSTSLLLGLTLGELKRNRVLFIDGRMERKSFGIYSEMFGLMKNALSYNNGCGNFQCYNTKNRNLCFLTPAASVESLEVFSNTEFVHLVAELREAFDYVIFDLPPLLGASETRMALPSLDLFFLVCSAKGTTFADIEKSKKMAASLGRPISGVVLNRQRAPFWTWLFGKDAFF